jgi:CysZ protein
MKYLLPFQRTNKIIWSDKKIILLSMIPICIGLILYYFLGLWIYTDVLMYLNSLVSGMVIEGGILATAITWVLGILLTLGVYFLVSWTFVLVIGLLAGPFNDLISERIFKANNIMVESTFETFGVLKGSYKILIIEIKKTSIIISLSLICLIIGLFPILSPFALLLNILIFCANFFSFGWSNLKYGFKPIMNDLFKKVFANIIYGAPLMILTTIPLVNLIAYPYCVVFFTQLMIDRHQELKVI